MKWAPNLKVEILRWKNCGHKRLVGEPSQKRLRTSGPLLRLSALGGGTGNLAFFGEGNQNRHAIFRPCLCPSQPRHAGGGGFNAVSVNGGPG